MKVRSNLSPSNDGSDSAAGPTTMSTRSPTPARSRLARATSAYAGLSSSVVSLPSAGIARASQIVLYPPSVPNSSTRRAPIERASRCRNRPCTGGTWMGGRPACSAAASADDNASSCGSRNHSSRWSAAAQLSLIRHAYHALSGQSVLRDRRACARQGGDHEQGGSDRIGTVQPQHYQAPGGKERVGS